MKPTRPIPLARSLTLMLGFLLCALPTLGQMTEGEVERLRDDRLGSTRYNKQGIMNGNQVRTIYLNQGEVAQWPNQPSGEWPRGSGHSYLDGVAVLVGSRFVSPGGPEIETVATAYREWMDQDPVTGTLWGWGAVPGYTADGSEIPALSNRPDSWPATWPSALGLGSDWDGLWYGYFGRGVQNADLETFFVMDDAQDAEFSQPPFNYFPIDGNTSRLGMGLRVEVRGFQWAQVLAEDNIFWHYDIVNLSERDYPEMAFGFYTDVGIGGTNDSGDDRAFYDTDLDIAYGFDGDGVGTPGAWQPVGYLGYAYLESPGDPFNGLDDDNDGLVDERRDDGLDNDGDWRPFSDDNGNGVWDAEDNEALNDDVGADGVGPFASQYTGPDEGEGDGLPTAGEPNFDRTDKDESDQIGLESLNIYRLIDGGGGDGWPRNDGAMYDRMTSNTFDTELQRANVSMVFGAGPFELRKHTRERFSMSLVFGEDLDDLTFNKETVQAIYDANYNFAQPPLKPTLTAVAGDGKVTLFWDTRAEQSFDRFLREYDFEGYLVYRSQEPEFEDIKTITDSRGTPRFWEPIAQYDLKNDHRGPDPIGINGAHFWLGSDTGLRHSYVDTTVTNGVRYYYAIAAYDRGAPQFGTSGLPSSQTNKIIRENFSGQVEFVDINAAVVEPRAPAAGYVPPEVELVTPADEPVGSADLGANVLNPNAVTEGNTYSIIFHSEGAPPEYRTTSYDIVRESDGGAVDTLVTRADASLLSPDPSPSLPFDGLSFTLQNDTTIAFDPVESGWVEGDSGVDLFVREDTLVASRTQPWPADYEVIFHDEDVYTTPFFGIDLPFTVHNVTYGYQVDVEVFDANGNRGSIDVGDPVTIIEYLDPDQQSSYRFAWVFEAIDASTGAPSVLVGANGPEAGDRYRIATTRPFAEGDRFAVRTKTAAHIDAEAAEEGLDRIRVVPNPYIVSAQWEQRTLNQTGRGERRLEFTHLPQQCTIRIYTASGALVDVIEHQSTMDDGSASWDLVSRDQMDIAYGVYIYHIDAPGVGERIGKFAVIK